MGDCVNKYITIIKLFSWISSLIKLLQYFSTFIFIILLLLFDFQILNKL